MIRDQPISWEVCVTFVQDQHWTALTPVAQETLVATVTKYTERPRLALLSAFRGLLTTRAHAAAAGVTPGRVRHWKSEHAQFRDDLEMLTAWAQARLEERHHDVSMGDTEGTRNEVRNRIHELAARDPETFGMKLDVNLNLGEQNKTRDREFFEGYDAFESGRQAGLEESADVVEGEARELPPDEPPQDS